MKPRLPTAAQAEALRHLARGEQPPQRRGGPWRDLALVEAQWVTHDGLSLLILPAGRAALVNYDAAEQHRATRSAEALARRAEELRRLEGW